MLSRRAFIAVVASASAIGPLAAATDLPAAQMLSATDVHVPGYPTVEAIRWIGDNLLRETEGRFGLRLYHSGQLGRESDSIDMARFGALDITRVSGAALNNPFPATRVLGLPYVFDSTAHLRRCVDGSVGAQILAGFAARDLIGLALYDSGTRCLYNTQRAIHEPGDLRGLKIRVPPSDIFMATVRAFGANPTPLPYGEVFSALQTRLIDGAENNWQSFHTTRQFEVARHWSQSAHSFLPEALLLSKRRYDALPPRDRDLLVDIARRSVGYMRELWDRSETAARDYVIAHGVTLNEVDLAAFQRAAAPVVDRFRTEPLTDALYRDIRALA
ncbi:MAG: TRAP transporter substrate-binding protein [Tahibacter sp.]